MNSMRLSSGRSSKSISSAMMIFAITIMASPASADEATKQRFLREYPAASKFLAERFRNVRCTYKVRHYSCSLVTEKTNEFRKSGSSEKLEAWRQKTYSGYSEARTRHVIVMRDGPVFSIVLDPITKRFVDTKLQMPNPLVELVRDVRNGKPIRKALQTYEDRITKYDWTNLTAGEFEYECGQYVYAPWGFGPSQIERFMQEPSFRLIDAHADPADPGIVEVRFHRINWQEMTEYVVRFDTKNHWAMTSMASASSKSPNVQNRSTVQYGPAIDGVRWPERVEKQFSPAAWFTNWSFEPTPEAEFRRSHYGLKDPWFE